MTVHFTLLDAAVPEDRRRWTQVWERSPMQLPFAHVEVAELALPPHSRLLAALLEDERSGGTIFYPFALRMLADGMHHDLITPYAYGGPLIWGFASSDAEAPGTVAREAEAPGTVAREDAVREFWTGFDAWAAQEHVVSEFIRFSLFADTAPYPGRVRERNLNFIASIPEDAEQMWGAMSPKVRQNVRRAERLGLRAVVDEDGALLDDFLRIYTGTMMRHDSDEYLRYDKEFLLRLHEVLGKRLIYVHVLRDDVPVSADLMLMGSDTGYYFIGGTDAEAFGARPNELVKTTVMEWLRENGYRHYVLGGGMHPGDGLERYKKGFAPSSGTMFCTGERILDPAAHAQLEEKRKQEFLAQGWAWDDSSLFFPSYRQPMLTPLLQPTGAG